MNKSKAEKIVARLLSNAAELVYGNVSVVLKVHDRKVVRVLYSTTENMIEPEVEKQEGE